MYSLITIVTGIMFLKLVFTLLAEAKNVHWSAIPHNVWIFIEDNVFWVILGFFIMFGIYGYIEQRRADRRYRSVPTSSQYAASNPKHPKGGGQSCQYCGSRSIRNWGRSSANDSERIFICNHCGETLYRNR